MQEEEGGGGDSSAGGDYPPLDRIVLAAARRYASLSAPLVYLRESGTCSSDHGHVLLPFPPQGRSPRIVLATPHMLNSPNLA